MKVEKIETAKWTLVAALILLLSILLLVYSVATAQDYRTWKGGYVVMLNAEAMKGVVYKRDGEDSVLIIMYPSTNSAFAYSAKGKQAFDYDLAILVMSEQVEGIIQAVSGIIMPAR